MGDRLAAKYEKIQEQYESAKAELADKHARKVKVELFTSELKKQKTIIEEFSEDLFRSLVDRMMVDKKGQIKVVFKNGMVL